jgi:uncharacterized protein (DUF58 family)
MRAGARGRLHCGVTEAGKMLLRGVVYIGLAALIIPVFGALSVLVSVTLLALVIGFVVRPRISIRVSLPDTVIAGQPAQLTYTLRNIGRLSAYHLHLHLPGLPDVLEQVGQARPVSRLGPGESAEVTVTVQPKRRGCWPLKPPICQSGFPFNLFQFGTSAGEQEVLLVLPAFSLLRMPLRYVSRPVTTGSVRLAGRTGTSPEYVGSRPFLPGDSPHHIDVRAWARLSVPATKEYDNDLDTHAVLVLDTRVPERRRAKSKEIRELEAAVSLCASVAYSIHHDCLIDTLLAGPDLHSFAAWPKRSRLDRIHEVLAVVEPCADETLEPIVPLLEKRFAEMSEAIFILMRWDRLYRRLVESADRAGCHCTVVIVAEPESRKGAAIFPLEDAAVPPGPFGPSGLPLFPEDILAGRIQHL